MVNEFPYHLISRRVMGQSRRKEALSCSTVLRPALVFMYVFIFSFAIFPEITDRVVRYRKRVSKPRAAASYPADDGVT